MAAFLASSPLRRSSTWICTLLLVPSVSALDSRLLAERISYGQWLALLLVGASFLAMQRGAPPRLKGVMWWGLLVAALGEVLFSLIFGMYEYRLANVPLYVPFGHSVLYAGVYYFIREPFVRSHQNLALGVMLSVGGLYSAYWLGATHDVYGALCTVVFGLLIWREPSSRLFFAAMFLLVGLLELFGTGFGCWVWPSTLLDRVALLPSGNPPSGISVFYFAFDASCLSLYILFRKGMFKRYVRLSELAKKRSAEAPNRAQLGEPEPS